MLIAQTDRPLTPAQAMFDMLANAGYVHYKIDFARMIGIYERNVYNYLGEPGTERFLAPSVVLLHGWAHAIRKASAVEIEIRLFPDGRLVLDCTGRTKNGSPFEVRYETTYHLHPWGFRPSGQDRETDDARS